MRCASTCRPVKVSSSLHFFLVLIHQHTCGSALLHQDQRHLNHKGKDYIQLNMDDRFRGIDYSVIKWLYVLLISKGHEK